MCGRNYAELLGVDALSLPLSSSFSLFSLFSGVSFNKRVQHDSTATLRKVVNHSKAEAKNMIIAHKGSAQPFAHRRSSFPPPAPNLFLTHLVERATVLLRVLRRSTRHLATVPLPLVCHNIPKGTKLELERGAPGEHHPQPTRPPPRFNRMSGSRKQ